ncbi:endolytic transglycosylase MltG [Acetohalobium arabaticum]|uniref:Endolytic murein transglycosylase n=1 Tax=Acetohalobium arabaticum (strain ATCC 49924 / DSM 5501 / Z-7288) TaxID=574087 RepID=D9QUQ5_ACEAZ|nr:endolytic transglycosylase MltG [Acetohalobium arabaticum]ADL11964.1 aminodeoxychorismate lyase [Acetohalobium arabaticum DSM 5501]
MFDFQSRNRNLAAVVIMILFILTLTSISYLQKWTGPVDRGAVSAYEVEVKSGASSGQIANLLFEKKLIRHPFLFKALVRFKGVENKLRAGYYRLSTGMSIDEMIDKLVSNEVITYQVTIPEGYTVEEIGDKLSKKAGFSKKQFLTVAEELKAEFSFAEEIDVKHRKYPLEGYLFPETYSIPKGTAPENIIKLMVGQFKEKLIDKLITEVKQSKYSLDEIITIASLVEAEVKYDKERRLIAGVIHNRLNKNMLLQIDATIQYILPEHKEQILYKDLALDSPYNTYQRLGLPPGPINNPGLASIRAALNPAETDYLYYFALEDGSHKFSETYQEHLRLQNKLKY